MLVSQMRARLLAATKRGQSSFTNAELDYALQGALHDLDLTGRVNRAEVTATLTAGNPEVSFTAITGFRPDRVTRVEIKYSDEGAWSDASVSYAISDLVTNDGKFYVCRVAHTSSASNEPGTDGGGSYWELRLWKRGNRLSMRTYDSTARQLGDTDSRLLDPINRFVRDEVETRGEPTEIAFLTEGKGYAFPVPDAAYSLTLVIESPIEEWDAGAADPDVDLPLSALLPIIEFGAASRIDPLSELSQARDRKWTEKKDQIRSTLIIAKGDGIKDESEYLDIGDELPTGRL